MVKKRYNECYDRNVYKERVMPWLKCDVLNGVYSNTESPGKHVYVFRQRELLGVSNIIAYELRLVINDYFKYDKDLAKTDYELW